MKRIAVLLYGVVAYLIFFATFLYLIGFTGNLLVPKSLDGPLEGSRAAAALVNLLLIALFGVQHSVMARPAFKRWWTKFVPKPIERSTFVLFTSACLISLFAFWQPLGGTVWEARSPFLKGALYATFGLGWTIVLVSTFLINHFDLFGLRQVWLYFRGRPYTHMPFRTPMFYKHVRHPLYLGFLLAFWSAPVMTATHLLFAGGLTAYILTAIRLEEKDLIHQFGEQYRRYRQIVPMLFPALFRKKEKQLSYLTIMQGIRDEGGAEGK